MVRAFCSVLALILSTSAWSTAHAAPPARQAAKTVTAWGRALVWGGAGVGSVGTGVGTWCWQLRGCHPIMWDPKSDHANARSGSRFAR